MLALLLHYKSLNYLLTCVLKQIGGTKKICFVFFRANSSDGSGIPGGSSSDFGHFPVRSPELAAEVSAHRIDTALRRQGRSPDGG